MRSTRQVVAALLLVVGIFAARPVCAEQPDKLAKPTSYVADFAGVIDEGSKARMEALSQEIYEKAKATVVIVTIHSTEGVSIENWTTQLEDLWKVGPKGTDRGVVMVYAVDDKKQRIEIGYGLEGILNDAKVGDIERSIKPQWDAGERGTAILSAEQQIGNVIAADAGVTLTDSVPPPTQTQRRTRRGRSGFSWMPILFLIFFVVVISGRGRGGRGGGGGGGGWMWFLLGNMLGGGFGGGGNRGFGDGDGGSWGGGGGGGGDFGGGFGGGSGGGGASGDL